MNNPDLYDEISAYSKSIATDVLNEYVSKLKWTKSGDCIIDVGCADAGVTCLIKKYVPVNYLQFVACDINKNMLEYAKKHHGQEDIIFRELDIEGDIPDDLRCGFNHVFSFLLFHWVQNQEQGFKNIFNLMKPGGDCLLSIFAFKPITYIYHAIAKDQSMKWGSHWLTDINKFVSVYCHMQNPDKYIADILKNIGFTNIDVQCKKKSYVFQNIVEIKKLTKSVEPFGMPEDVFEEFFCDFVIVGQKLGFLDKNVTDINDLMKEVPYDYQLLTVYATKPE